MTYKTILAAVSGGTASSGVMELACRLAHRFDAHLEGFHVRINPVKVLAPAFDGVGIPLPTDSIDDIAAQAAATAAKTKTAFEACIARHRLAQADAPGRITASTTWREETGAASDMLSRRARFFDLVVLGHSTRAVDHLFSNTVEEAVTRSGRPVLLAPAQPPSTTGERIALGWNGSPAAVRALAATLPLLTTAQAVTIIAIGERAAGDLPFLVEYLAWHGVVATQCGPQPLSGVRAGEGLLAKACEAAADLLVMGGHNHVPCHEILLSGATRDDAAGRLLPVLLSH
jgi:nucleotide-binding universal stress UspA family protein